jgi:hypothetical protein
MLRTLWLTFIGCISQCVLKAGLGDKRRSDWEHVCKGFSDRNLRVLTPMAAMPAGVVTLLGVSLWVPSP